MQATKEQNSINDPIRVDWIPTGIWPGRLGLTFAPGKKGGSVYQNGVTHARDVALVIDTHMLLVERLGLDGVHLTDGARSVRKMRKDLGADAIIGAFCGASRHDGMSAGEYGADYVSFGPVGLSPLGSGEQAGLELFQWWSEMIEVAVVAEGALTPDLIRSLTPHADFFGIGDEIWGADDPVKALLGLAAAIS